MASTAPDLPGQGCHPTEASDIGGPVDWLAGYKSPQPALAERLPVQAVFGLSEQIIPREQAFHLPAKIACHMIRMVTYCTKALQRR